MAVRTISLSLLLSVGLTGCTESRDDHHGPPSHRIDEALTWETRIDAEETDQVINVRPDIVPDREGFLVADRGEQQIRSYSANGSLEFYFGSRGDGPREFRRLQSVVRLPTDEILTLESDGAFKLITADGAELVETFSIEELHRALQMMVLTDSTILVGARLASGLEGPQLHIIDVKRRAVLRSFFNPFGTASSKTAALAAGWVGFDVRNDTVAATFSVSDTLYYFSTEGASLGRLQLPSEQFRVAAGEPDREATQQPASRAEWLASFDLVDRPRFVPQGLLVSYQTVVASRALERNHHLILMQTDGLKLWEVRDTPQLLTIARNRPLFRAPSSEVPNQWQFARILVN